MSKVSKICGIDAEAIAALLSLEIGELREKLAYADGNDDFSDWLEDEFEFEADDFEVDEDDIELEDNDDDDDDYEDYDDCEDEDDDYWDRDDDEVTLPSDQEDLAQEIARDIRDGKYTVASIMGAYTDEFIARVNELV